MVALDVGLSHHELLQERGRQIRQQALLWRALAAEMRGDSHQLRRHAQHLTTVSREVAQRTVTLLQMCAQSR
jgi:hypothetical protein